MQVTENRAELFKALAAAQGEFTTVEKNATNPHFKSKFAPLDSIIEMIRPILPKHGLSVMQHCDIPESGKGIIIETVIAHESGQYVSSRLFMPVSKEDPQGYGSSVTYGRRYALGAALGIVSDEDVDGNQSEQGPQQRQQRQPRQQQAPTQSQPPAADLASESQRNLIFAKMKEHGVSGDALKAEFKLTSSKEIKKSQVNDILAWLEKQQPALCADCRQPVSNHAPSCPQAQPPIDEQFEQHKAQQLSTLKRDMGP